MSSSEEASNNNYPTTGIEYPGVNDCLCGRGGHSISHQGNVRFRMLVEKYKEQYVKASRYEKAQVTSDVVRFWRKQTPPGRFLTMTDPSKGDTSPWHDIGDKGALKKVAQCLRERSPRTECVPATGAAGSAPGTSVAPSSAPPSPSTVTTTTTTANFADIVATASMAVPTAAPTFALLDPTSTTCSAVPAAVDLSLFQQQQQPHQQQQRTHSKPEVPHAHVHQTSKHHPPQLQKRQQHQRQRNQVHKQQQQQSALKRQAKTVQEQVMIAEQEVQEAQRTVNVQAQHLHQALELQNQQQVQQQQQQQVQQAMAEAEAVASSAAFDQQQQQQPPQQPPQSYLNQQIQQQLRYDFSTEQLLQDQQDLDLNDYQEQELEQEMEDIMQIAPPVSGKSRCCRGNSPQMMDSEAVLESPVMWDSPTTTTEAGGNLPSAATLTKHAFDDERNSGSSSSYYRKMDSFSDTVSNTSCSDSGLGSYNINNNRNIIRSSAYSPD